VLPAALLLSRLRCCCCRRAGGCPAVTACTVAGVSGQSALRGKACLAALLLSRRGSSGGGAASLGLRWCVALRRAALSHPTCDLCVAGQLRCRCTTAVQRDEPCREHRRCRCIQASVLIAVRACRLARACEAKLLPCLERAQRDADAYQLRIIIIQTETLT
jgi:hypothetical protein